MFINVHTCVTLLIHITSLQFLSPPFLSRRRGHERCVDPLPRFYDFMIFLEYSVHEHTGCKELYQKRNSKYLYKIPE